MAYDDSVKKEDCFDGDHSFEDIGLAAGRSQREKKRSYKDFLREEEEIAAQVRNSSKKKLKDSELYFLGTDTHKKKRKHSDDYYYGDIPSLESSQKKKKKSSPQSADSAMDLLKAITSPLAAGSKPSKKSGEKSSSSSSHSESKKEHHRKKFSGSSGELSLEDGGSHKPKKMKPLYVNTETLTLREPDGLKMKLILSPKEKGSSSVDEESFQYPSQHATVKKPSKKSARDEQGALLLGHELQSFLKTARKKHKSSSDPHSSPGPEGCGSDASQFPESHSANLDLSGLEPILVESDSSSGGELEAGELVIDDSYREVKKKKKSKKSKKKKDKEKHREKRHSKSRRSSGLPAAVVGEVPVAPGPPPSTPYPAAAATPPPLPGLHTDGHSEKKKKREEKERERERGEKPKKKNMSAYQVFCKEYRVTIVADHPGIDFGELSKKLAEVWKQLPEKDKLIWKQKAQYLQHKQNKAEATTVKRKASGSEGSVKVKAASSGALSPQKSPPTAMLLPASPAKAPETQPIDVAAHLQLLGESLSLIGHRLQETEGMVAVSGSLSVLLDSIICALGPLACLTTQLPELNGCPKQVLSNTLDNIAYIMPGL
ncbi:HMG domain-containing protein 4 isoform X4 [Oryctolagus cuniculus]|uniref:High mobility group protein 2-like 1 n=1 Tax=Oryctolagus cuniculus TaxID=9986 RepID=G1SZN5_RABIT|nr:HMG domain-containing protein 4 isoform X2 [Oryctolagus cuniculus]XP_017197605.1 HMG domain-containing protein 4 isoform X2 [Oryctolagus cuniculus]XP_017197606.1 HMG domain-containing protein 4 isoform X2 [Oryctolagus cuniculus]